MEKTLNDITVKIVDGSGVLVLTSVNEFIFTKEEINFLQSSMEFLTKGKRGTSFLLDNSAI